MDAQEVQLRERLKRMLKRPGDYWIPNSAQWNFLKLFGGVGGYENNENTWVESNGYPSENFIIVFPGANGTGKTEAVVIAIGVLLGLIHNPYVCNENGELYPFFRYPPAGGRGRLVSTPTAFKETIVPKMLEYFPQGGYICEKRGQEYFSYFEGVNKRSCTLLSYEQDLDKFESATLGWAIFDEPDVDASKFIATTARMRRGGRIAITATPLNTAAWVHDLVIGNTNWKVGTVYARIWVNSKDAKQGLPGILDPADIDRMIAGWSEEEYKARALGQFMHLSGKVYPQFNRKVHVVDPREIPQQGTLYCAMDPHDSRPPFIGWFRVTPDGRIYMVDEYPRVKSRRGRDLVRKVWYEDLQHDSLTIADYAREILNVEKAIGTPRQRIMDPRFGNKRYPNSNKLVYEEYCDLGVDFSLAPLDPTLARGHAKVRMLLNYDLTGEKEGRVMYPRLYISSVCENTIRAFERYIYDPVYHGGREVVNEKYKDEMDVVRMAADADWEYYEPPPADFYRRMNHREQDPFAGLR